MNRNFKTRIKTELQDFTAKQMQFFAWLCAVRALPFLGIKRRFSFWKRSERQEHLFSLFWTLDVVNLLTISGIRINKEDATEVAHSAAKASVVAANATRNSTAHHAIKSIACAANAVSEDVMSNKNVTNIAISLSTASVNNAQSAVPFFGVSSKLAFVIFLILISSIPFLVLVFAGDIIKQATTLNDTTILIIAFILALAVGLIIYTIYSVIEKRKVQAFSRIIINDIHAIKYDDLESIDYNTQVYNKTWVRFIKNLRRMKCGYWADLYENLFENKFVMDKDELWRRISIPRREQARGVVHVAEYLEREKRDRDFDTRRRNFDIKTFSLETVDKKSE